MKQVLLIVCLFQFLIAQNCVNQKAGEIPYCWFNVKYLDCLKQSLPCDCEKKTETYYSLVVDTNSKSKNFGVSLLKYDLMEPILYSIKKISSREYEVISDNNDPSFWARLIIENDSVYFIENAVQSVFCKANRSNTHDTQHYLYNNVDLLNRAFVKKGYPQLENIVKDDSLICECNKWKGNINLLSIDGKPASWMLEMKNDSLYINTATYPHEDPDPDDSIIFKKFKAYKW